MCFVSAVYVPKLSAYLVFSSSTVEWSSPWKELITKATATALSAVEAWGNRLVTEDTTSTIGIYGEEKNTETVCLLVWADNGGCQNDLPCSDKLSECHSTWGMETSVQHIVLLVLPNICSWLLCMFFVWWFSPSSRSSCAYLWSLIKTWKFVFCLPTMVHTVPKQLWQWNCEDILKMLWLFCCGCICSFVGSVFFCFRSEGNFGPLEFFSLQQIKLGIHKSKFAALLFLFQSSEFFAL